MLSVTSLKPFSLFLNPHPPKTLHPHHNHLLLLRPISAIPPSSSSSQSFPPSPLPNQQLYQPFRPPPLQQPSLSFDTILDVLRNRLGLWHEYAPLIPLLSRHHSFTPPSIEESTGISGIEQNRLIVAAQVRDSLISSHVDPEVVSLTSAASSSSTSSAFSPPPSTLPLPDGPINIMDLKSRAVIIYQIDIAPTL